MADISHQTRLSTLQAMLRGDRATEGRVNPRFVKSIQQSLAVEGYVFSEQSVREVGEQAAR